VRVRAIENEEIPFTERIQKIGDSFYILLPSVVRKALDLKEGDIVTVYLKVVKKNREIL